MIDHLKTEPQLNSAPDGADAAKPATEGAPGDHLIARMNHEIRTTVNAILGLTQLLLESDLTPEQEYHVNIVRASADHLLTESGGILDLAKAEIGDLQLQNVRFNPHETLRQALDLTSILARHHGVRLRSHISDQVPASITGDPDRINQVLIAVLRAGIKQAGTAEISIRVEPGETTDKGMILRFSVSHAGPRMLPNLLSHIFEGRADGDAASQEDSGLALSKLIVEMMGGAMWAETTSDSGNVFHFNVIVGAAEPAQSIKDHGKSHAKDRSDGRRLKILVAEDATDNLLLIRAFLKDESCMIDSAANGRVAMQKAATASYDLILMDLDMPEMDGYTATRRIRTSECHNELPAVPIVALTAHNHADASMKSMEAGCNAHVTKPFTKATLLDTIRRFAAARFEQPVNPSTPLM